MDCVPVGASRRLRWGCLGLAAIVAMLRRHQRPADARRASQALARHGSPRSRQATTRPTPPSWSTPTPARCCMQPPRRAAPPGLADQDHDALSAVRAPGVRQDLARHARWRFPRRPRARRRPSSDFRPGDTLKVEDAIKGLVTKSANDAAVVIAEALGGSVDEFARMMTRKAHALGMTPHHLPQSQRPARRRADHHRARPGPARHRDPGTLPEVLPLFLARRASSSTAAPCATTTTCSARSRASTASRPATPATPVSTSSPRSGAAPAISSPWCWAAAPPAAATRACAN